MGLAMNKSREAIHAKPRGPSMLMESGVTGYGTCLGVPYPCMVSRGDPVKAPFLVGESHFCPCRSFANIPPGPQGITRLQRYKSAEQLFNVPLGPGDQRYD